MGINMSEIIDFDSVKQDAERKKLIEYANSLEQTFLNSCYYHQNSKRFIQNAISIITNMQKIIQFDELEDIKSELAELSEEKMPMSEEKLSEKLMNISVRIEEILKEFDIGMIIPEDSKIGVYVDIWSEEHEQSEDEEIEDYEPKEGLFSKILGWFRRLVEGEEDASEYDDDEHVDEYVDISYNGSPKSKFICLNSGALFNHRS